MKQFLHNIFKYRNSLKSTRFQSLRISYLVQPNLNETKRSFTYNYYGKLHKKIDHKNWEKESFGRKMFYSTLALESVRLKFKVENQLVPTVRKNFSRKYRNSTFSCQSCVKDTTSNPSASKPQDSQLHLLLECKAFSDLRESLNTNDDYQVVEFFRKVVEQRQSEGID